VSEWRGKPQPRGLISVLRKNNHFYSLLLYFTLHELEFTHIVHSLTRSLAHSLYAHPHYSLLPTHYSHSLLTTHSHTHTRSHPCCVSDVSTRSLAHSLTHSPVTAAVIPMASYHCTTHTLTHTLTHSWYI
jgi:hypothetical protein